MQCIRHWEWSEFMYEYAKHEFGRWLSTLDVNQLDTYQKRLIGLLVEHFNDIAAVGTAK